MIAHTRFASQGRHIQEHSWCGVVHEYIQETPNQIPYRRFDYQITI
jgi:hypothetical protein